MERRFHRCYFCLLFAFFLCCWIPRSVKNVFATPSTIKSSLVEETSRPTTASPPINVTKAVTYNTTATSFCGQTSNTSCPDEWYQADEDTCLSITIDDGDIGYLDSYECWQKGAALLANEITPNIRSCLLRQLASSHKKMILLRGGELFDLSTNATSVHDFYDYSDISNSFHRVCALYLKDGGAPAITSFSLEITDFLKGTRRTVDLLSTNESVTIDEGRSKLNLTCRGAGHISTGANIRFKDGTYYRRRHYIHENLRQADSLTISGAACDESGVYECEVRNPFGRVQIEKEIVIKGPIEVASFAVKNHNSMRAVLILEDTAEMTCSVNTCGDPITLSIVDNEDRSLELVRAHRKVSVSYVIGHVKCSDLGTYVCLAEKENGDISEKTLDLIINDKCPVAAHRSETTLKIISAALGQTVNASFRLISLETPSLAPGFNASKVKFSFTRPIDSKVSLIASITICDVQKEDFKTHTIGIRNVHGTLFLNITIIPDTGTELRQLTGQGDSGSQGQVGSNTDVPAKIPDQTKMNFLTITLPIMFINAILVFIIAAIIYTNKGKLITSLSCRSKPEYTELKEDNDKNIDISRTQL